jgi:flotillin
LLLLPQLFCLYSRLHKRQALVVMSERSMNMALIIGIVAVLIIIFGFLCYKKAPPTEAIVVTGFGLSKPKVVSGKGTFVLPVLQRADKLNMRLLKIDVKTPETGVKTQNGVSLILS